jgi:vancomycin resistance protein YoaR
MPDHFSPKIARPKSRWLLRLAAIFFVFLLLAMAGLTVFDNMFKNKIYPNVFIGNFNLGGQSVETAEQLINQEVDKINQHGLIFSYKDKSVAVTPVIASADGALAYQIINFNVGQTVAAALNSGRSGNFFIDSKNKFLSLILKRQLPLALLINQKEITKILQNNFSQADQPAQDASLITKKLLSINDYGFSLIGEKSGKVIDYEKALANLSDNLSRLDTTPIKLTTVSQYPKIFLKDCLNIEAKARNFLNLAPLTLTYGENKWFIDQDQLSQLLALKLNDSAGDKIMVGLSDSRLKDYLAKKIAPAINQEPLEAKFTVNNGKVTEFQNSQDGQALDLEASLAKIEGQIAATNSIDLIVKPQPALSRTSNINDYGIKEIIGVGASSFAGSPANRRHNISVGASTVNGLLIKPGEEFSLLKALGQVASSTGYLPELVIKEGKTTPEYGGGLCQIGTTMFRAALASGLPITMRRNHSYRVQYYEPAGTDATIYDPWPDLRFINDSPSYILIQTKIASSALSFEFWGSRDGRQTQATKPTIYNIVKPEPTKTIETLDLKPGEKKCTEKPHNGADAYFDYKVTYPDGTIKEKRFSSHYVPWQEICLLGVEELSVPTNDAATSTPTTNVNPTTTN